MSNKTFGQGLSIIIPVAGRVKLLEKLLKSLKEAQTNFNAPCEVLILDNSPEIEEQQAIRTLAENCDAIYAFGSDNLSEKRNQGIEMAQHEIILFLDSDCTATPNLLQEHYRMYQDPVVSGCLGLLEFTGHDTFVWKAVEQTAVLTSFAWPKSRKTVMWGPTANISFRHETLLDIGGFDTDFALASEDVDIGFRLTKAGGTIACNPHAIAYHTKETWASFNQIFRRFMRYGVGDVLLIRKHPERTTWESPLPIHFLLLLSLFSFAAIMLTQKVIFVILPIIWAVLTLLLYPLITARNEQHPTNMRGLALHAMTLILYTGLDLGRFFTSFRWREARGFYRKIIYSENQLLEEWPDISISTIASVISLLCCLFIGTLILI